MFQRKSITTSGTLICRSPNPLFPPPHKTLIMGCRGITEIRFASSEPWLLVKAQ
jgi:hypothetical protein